MLQRISKYYLFIIISFILGACSSSQRPIQESEEKLPKVKETTLIYRLDSLSKLRPDHFYSKISSKYSDSELNVSFKTSVRMRADSALNAIITFARIPIYNSMVTPDTLTIVDKRNNCYVKETMGYLKETFSVDFEHHNIEEILLGLPTGWELDEDYYQIKDPYNYVISSHNKRKLKRSDKDLSGDVYIRYFLSDDAKNLKRIIIDSPMDTTSIDINYYEREEVNSFNVPLEADVRVYTPKDTIYIDLNYSKTTVNEPRVLYLSIPDKYERCD